MSGPAGVPRAEAHEPIRMVDVRPPGDAIGAVARRLRLRRRPEPHGLGGDPGRAPAGTPVELFYSEKLNPDGTASTNGNGLVLGQLQTDDYIAKGTGDEVWAPRFSYKGFQYVQISGPGGQPLPDGASVSVERIQHVRSGLTRTSSFESGQATLDRIHRNTVWAIQSNMHGVITDTPVYEKNPWTGDAQLTAGTASLLFDTERLYRKMFQDMLDAQTPQGEVPLLVPATRTTATSASRRSSPSTAAAPRRLGRVLVRDPLGELPPLRRPGRAREGLPGDAAIPGRWIPRWTSKDGDGHPYTLTSGLGDWVAPAGVPTLNALASSAYYAHLVRIAA